MTGAALIVLFWVVWLGGAVAAIRRPREDYERVDRPKTSTVWLILLSGFVGGTYYLLVIRREMNRAKELERQPAQQLATD